jgi:hypothetical protein
LLPKNSAQQHQHPASLLLLLLLLHDDADAAAAAADDDADAYYYYTVLISLQKTLLFLYPLPSSLAQKLLLQATSLESRIFPSLQTVTTILQQQKISLPKKYQNTKQALDKTQSAQMGMCKMSTHTHTHTHTQRR